MAPKYVYTYRDDDDDEKVVLSAAVNKNVIGARISVCRKVISSL